jgi:hypothetical protein
LAAGGAVYVTCITSASDGEHRLGVPVWATLPVNAGSQPVSIVCSSHHYFEDGLMVKRFEELRTMFCAVKKQFDQAESLQEKQRLVSVSKQIIRAAASEIEEYRKTLSVR